MKKELEVSVVVPCYNEERNIKPLYQEVTHILNQAKISYEIIFVDDGSSDRTLSELLKVKNDDQRVKVIQFRGNFGQTAAMDAGFKNAKGKVIMPMDADLQNDPADIPRLLRKINEGYDVVSGWRFNRKDSLLKHFVSRGANLLRKILVNDTIHDSGCTLKAYRKECFDDLDIYGEMHRFIPALLRWRGFKITELKVNHRSRKFGKTKYGLTRIAKGFLDMLVVKFWMQYSNRPMHLFGSLGIISGILGGILMAYLAYVRLILGWGIGNRPLLLLAILLVIVCVQLILFGLISDILVKLYYKDHKNYSIKSII